MSATSRPYKSPLREEQARQTRTRILDAVLALLESGPETAEITVDAVAAEAGVQRRTVFRHFETRDALLAEAFRHLNDRMATVALPANAEALIAGPLQTFPVFDTAENLVRAAIHSRMGREMRAAAAPARRAAFAAALAPRLTGLAPEAKQRAEALAHLLYSASSWEVMKDYGGLTGTQAGETASWALETILSAIGSGDASADAASHTGKEIPR